jgi:hypothetical protein
MLERQTMLRLILGRSDAQAKDFKNGPLCKFTQWNGLIRHPPPNGERHGFFKSLPAGSFDVLVCHGTCFSGCLKRLRRAPYA